MFCENVIVGAIRDSEQTLPSSSEEHRPGGQSRHHGGGRAGEDSEQLPSCGLCSITAGRSGGETQCSQEEGEEPKPEMIICKKGEAFQHCWLKVGPLFTTR